MAPALVLNASYEPLSVVSGRRAAVLVLSDRADSVHESALVLRSESLEVPIPTVVRLRYFVRLARPRAAGVSRRAIFARDGGRCQYCSAKAESVDHVVPRSKGGRHTWENVVAACRPCNAAKRDRLLVNTSMRLARTPRAPGRHGWVVAAVGSVPESWLPYVGDTAAVA